CELRMKRPGTRLLIRRWLRFPSALRGGFLRSLGRYGRRCGHQGATEQHQTTSFENRFDHNNLNMNFVKPITSRLTSSLFLDLLARLFPPFESRGQIDQMGKSQSAHLIASPRAPHPRRAVNQINLIFLQLSNLLIEVSRIDIKVHRPRDMPVLE